MIDYKLSHAFLLFEILYEIKHTRAVEIHNNIKPS